MTAPEIIAICDRIGISPMRFAELAGGRPGNRPRWIRPHDPSEVPPAVATLARVADAVADHAPYPEIVAILRAEADRLSRL